MTQPENAPSKLVPGETRKMAPIPDGKLHFLQPIGDTLNFSLTDGL